MILEKEKNDGKLALLIRERDVYRLQVAKIQAGYEEKVKELSILKELGETLRFINDLDTRTFWENQINVLMRSFSFKAVNLLLSHSGQNILETVASVGQPPVFKDDLALEKKMAKQTFLTQRPVVRTTIQDDKSITQSNNNGALLCLPVLHNKTCIGILLFRGKEHDVFNSNMIRFLNLVADGFATGIILSRIYGQMIQEEKQRLNLSRFFSATVREKITSTKGNLRLGGERKHVTILFADLEGFTSMSERIDHEQVVEILNSYFSKMTPIIFAHNGTLDKLMGDGMMALFGAPLAHENDPYQAVITAIEMIKALKIFNEKNRNKGWPHLNCTIGINSGEVVAGYIGSEEHMNYTVIGDAVNVAQRIQATAESNKILISGSVRNEIRERIEEISDLKNLKKLPSRKLKGKKKNIDIYEVQV